MTWTKARIREPFIVSKYAKGRAHIPAIEGRALWYRGELQFMEGRTRCGRMLSGIRAVREVPDHLELCDRCTLADLGPAVYTFYAADGSALYVGSTKDPLARITWHAGMSKFWPLVARAEFRHYDTPADALVDEVARIRRLRPPHNTHYRLAAEVTS